MKLRRTLAGLTVLLLIIGIVPVSRYFVLNLVGVHATVVVEILDKSTGQPLRNVKITLRNSSRRTDEAGRAKFENAKLGTGQLSIERYAFAPVQKQITIGWGGYRLDGLALSPTGTQYALAATDYLSGQGVAGIEATSGPASALSDSMGEIVLTLENPEDHIDVTITGDGYRTEELSIGSDDRKTRPIELVPDRYHAFIASRSGKQDLYKVYADGRGEEKVLEDIGSGRTVLLHPQADIAAFVSASGELTNKGLRLDHLHLVDLETNQVEPVDRSEQIQLIGWANNRLVYTRITEGTNKESPERYKLISYDYKTQDERELAASNLFNDVLLAQDRIYYAPSDVYHEGAKLGLFSVGPDGNKRRTLIDGEVWNLFRSKYGTIDIAAPDGSWYDYNLNSRQVAEVAAEPEGLASRHYIDEPGGTKSLWTNSNSLLVYDKKNGADTTLASMPGLGNPVSWLGSNAAVFRVDSSKETADYVVSLDGGEPRKIRDVADTDGLDDWYYY